jgi:hypothetical protein
LTVRAVRYSRAPISRVQAVAGRPRDLGLLPGNVALATAALEWLSERTRVTSTEWALGIEALVRALLTEDEAAESLYREAIERLGGTQRPRAARLRSPALRRVAAPRAPPCRRAWAAAHRAGMLDAMGIGAFAERARRELLAAGETARKRTVETAGQGLHQARRQLP